MSIVNLNEQDVARLLDMPTAIETMRRAFLALAAGQADNAPRVRVRAPGAVLHSMSAAAGYLELLGWKQYTTTRAGTRFDVGLYEQTSGELIAWIRADKLGQLRTGAVTGLAVELLAANSADSLGLIGAGWQAESQLEAVAAVRPLREARVYCRDDRRRREFAERLSKRLDLDVRPADDARSAVRGQPIVVTATSSRSPVVEDTWLADETVLAAVGSNWPEKAEIAPDTVARGSLVVCDDVECCRQEAGELIQAAAAGRFDWSRAQSLCELVAAAARGERPDAVGLRLFKSVGMALEDVALGAVLLERAGVRSPGAS